jgi:hypothetical protein
MPTCCFLQEELRGVMERGVSDIVSGTLGDALKAAQRELQGRAESSRSAAQASSRSPSTSLPPVLRAAAGGSERPSGATSEALRPIAGMPVSLDAIAASANPTPPPDNLSFLVEQPIPRGRDLLAGGAGMMWAGTGAAVGGGGGGVGSTAGATPGALGAPTGLFFQTGPAMQAFLAARVGAGGVGAATPGSALGLGILHNNNPLPPQWSGVGGLGGGAPGTAGGFRSYTAPGAGAGSGGLPSRG